MLRCHAIPITAIQGPCKRDRDATVFTFSMHPRRKNCYRTSYRNHVAVQPTRVYTIQSPATCNDNAGTCSRIISFIVSRPVKRNLRACAIKQQQENLVIVVQEPEKSCRGRTGKRLALSFVELHEYYFEMFASVK